MATLKLDDAQTATNKDAATMIQAGFATTDITPDIGSHIPGGFAPRISTGVLDPLQARACVLRESETIAVVGVDAVSLNDATVADARSRIQARTDIKPRNILIAASHTHCGGPANNVLGTDADPTYLDLLAERIADAVAQAAGDAEPVRVCTGTASCHDWAFNRRWHMACGGHATNPGKGNPDMLDPAGPVDPEVGVIALLSSDGRVRGCITNFACHCTVVSGTTFSGDYPAYWQKALRKRLDKDLTMIFLNGACGDINQLDFSRPDRKESGPQWAEAMGDALAQATVEALQAAQPDDAADVAAAHGQVSVAYRRPTDAQLAEAAACLETFGPEAGRDYWIARDRQLLAQMLGDDTQVDVPVDVLRIGAAIIAAAPWQPFCEFGLRIKQHAPSPTLVATFANGMIGYVPTPAAFEGGGYEPTLCRGSKLHPEAGDSITDETIQLIEKMTNEE
jgi:hypothetical protein